MSENKAIDKANLELALSENNKKLLEYTDNADTKLRQEFGPVSKYQKYLNTELDSCFCMLSADYTPVVGEYVPFVKKSGSFEVNEGRIIIKPGQRAQINISVAYGSSTGSSYGNIKYAIKDYTNNVLITQFRPINNDGYNEYPEAVCCQYTNETDVNCEIGLYVSEVKVSDTIRCYYTSLTVQEINRQIVIDPVEHVNTEYGLEDAPVGHIISHMGTKAPSHYLICDGSEYDILLYPELANHILDNFGSYNYFGGDGINTFAVPDLRERFLKGSETAGVNEEAGLPNITANWKSEPSTDAHGAIWVTSEKGTLQGVTSGGSSDNRLHLDASRSSAVYGNSDTVTPANTSVLYCIKYEHTYYTKVNNTNYLSASLYSEEERVIGCWIDGKPLYERAFSGTTPSTHSATEIFSLTDSNVDIVIDVFGTINYSGNNYIPLTYAFISSTIEGSASAAVYFRNDSLTLMVKNSETYLSKPFFAVIQYTKTTDAENSFTEDMIKDYISSTSSEDISYTDAEIQAIIKEGVAEINEEA